MKSRPYDAVTNPPIWIHSKQRKRSEILPISNRYTWLAENNSPLLPSPTSSSYSPETKITKWWNSNVDRQLQ